MDLGWRRCGAACYLSFQRGAALFSLFQKERKAGCKPVPGARKPRNPVPRLVGALFPNEMYRAHLMPHGAEKRAESIGRAEAEGGGVDAGVAAQKLAAEEILVH